MTDWTRIPAPIDNEADRRALTAMLCAAGLEVRIVRERAGESKSAPWRRFIEFRAQDAK